jgi:hypothetical protein
MMAACGQQLASQAVGTEEADDVEVWPHGAFLVNASGSAGRRSVELQPPRGKRFLDGAGTAARAAELADVLMNAADDTLVILDLATNSFLD